MVNVPPSSTARSRIDGMPTPPPATAGSKPRPSSVTAVQRSRGPDEAHGAGVRPGVLRHVHQRLQPDPERGDLGRSGQGAERLGHVEPHVHPAQDPLGTIVQRGFEPELVEHRWPQVVHETADVADGGGEHRAELVEHPLRGLR